MTDVRLQPRSRVRITSMPPPDARERCTRCGRTNPVGFAVPNDIWTHATEARWDVLCIDCFCHIADRKLVRWEREITFWPVSLATSRQDQEDAQLPASAFPLHSLHRS